MLLRMVLPIVPWLRGSLYGRLSISWMAELKLPIPDMASIVACFKTSTGALKHCYICIIVSCVIYYIQSLHLNLIKLRRAGEGDDKPHRRAFDFRVFQVGD